MLPSSATPASRLRLGCLARPSPRPSLFTYGPGTRRQQSRGFRFGPWSTSAGSHVQRRHHALRYRYMEYLDPNRSWENGFRDTSISDCAIATSRLWRAQCSPSDGAYANLDDIKSWSDDISGLRPRKDTDHVEAKSLDPGSRSFKQRSPWLSLHRVRNPPPKRPSSVDAAPELDLDAPMWKESFIDPITNRRVTEPQRSSDPNRLSWTSSDHIGASLEQNNQQGSRKRKGLDGHAPESTNFYDALKEYSSVKTNDRPAPMQSIAKDAAKSLADLAKFKPMIATESEKSQNEPFKGCGNLERDATALRNEPDDVCKSAPKETSKNYPDLDDYGPVYFNEPNGRLNRTAEEDSSRNEALDQYKKLEHYKVPFVVDEATLSAHEERQQIFAPKAEPISAKIVVSSDDPAQQYTDLDKYGPVYWDEPDAFRGSSQDLGFGSHYSVTEPSSRLAHSRGAGNVASCNEPERRPGEQSKMEYEEPARKRPELDASRRTHAAHRKIASKVYTSLSRDGFESRTKSNETCSDTAANSRTLVDANRQSRSSTDGLLNKDCEGVHGSWLKAARDCGGFRTAADLRADVLRRARDDEDRAELQQAKLEHDLSWDATSKDAQDTLKQLGMKTERPLTGKDVGDFPQDFAASRSNANSSSKTTLVPKGGSECAQLATAVSETPDMDRDEAEPSSMDESFPSEESKLEPSLDGQTTRSPSTTAMSHADEQQVDEDLYSKDPQGLETSFAKECGGQTTPPFQARHYEAKTAAEPKDAPAEAEKRVSYRVLAYDAATGSLSMAETTSGVEDVQTWASPAAVLPRLSKPSKFLPHFAQLGEQGYEIVAGGGDVLVFGKARAASPEAPRQPAETCPTNTVPVNPIDLMGRPVTGNFASPTGFVNYDAPTGPDESKPSPPFRASGGVAGDEGGGGQRGGRGRKRGLGRKLVIGTAWVTGIAYAAGVLGEYFATGGADGLGPTGF